MRKISPPFTLESPKKTKPKKMLKYERYLSIVGITTNYLCLFSKFSAISLMLNPFSLSKNIK